MTGNAALGAGAGTNDVDNGKTTLTSSLFDATAGGNGQPDRQLLALVLEQPGCGPGEDFWRVDISNDGGANWTSVESTNQSDASWRRIVFRIADYADADQQHAAALHRRGRELGLAGRGGGGRLRPAGVLERGRGRGCAHRGAAVPGTRLGPGDRDRCG